MKTTFLLIAAALITTACATTENYGRALDTWKGKTELELVRAWGAPQTTHTTNGHKFLMYSDSSTLKGGESVQCNTTFELEGDKVVSWSAQGSKCRSF